MKCELGDHEADPLYSLGKRQTNGMLNTMSCRECALKIGWLCETHNEAHVGFQDKSHACLSCIWSETRALYSEAARIFADVQESLQVREFILLIAYAAASLSPEETLGNRVVREVVTSSLRYDRTVEETLRRMRTTGTIDCLAHRPTAEMFASLFMDMVALE